MNRRLFLGLVGGTIAAAATPEAFRALIVEAPPQAIAPFLTRYVNDVTFTCTETGIYTIGRADGLDLISTALPAGGIFRWAAPLGWELILPPSAPVLVIDGPGVDEWSMIWTEAHDDGHHRYTSDSYGHDRVPLTIGDLPGEAHAWLTESRRSVLDAEMFGEPDDDYVIAGD